MNLRTVIGDDASHLVGQGQGCTWTSLGRMPRLRVSGCR